MALTEAQQAGLEIATARFKSGKPYTIISGYAGTGKSFLVNAIVKQFKLREEQVAYACYTGKAALVLRNQGKNAMTLHKLLYLYFVDDNNNFRMVPRRHLASGIKLIILDEISMCPDTLWEKLLSYGVHVIGLGDPFQLPPVDAGEHKVSKLLQKPHVFLTEVLRQALDNDIVKYSLMLRQGKDLPMGLKGKNIQTMSVSELNTGMLQWADQILCGKNTTRNNLNKSVREVLGYTRLIEDEEKLVCTKNNWQQLSKRGTPLMNGEIGNVTSLTFQEDENAVYGNFRIHGDVFYNLAIDTQLLRTGCPTQKSVVRGSRTRLVNPYNSFDYGYAITVHKAQGSQYEKVLVVDDYWKTGEEHRRWLYTAITRATSKVVVLLENKQK